jgi:hypothetical protein
MGEFFASATVDTNSPDKSMCVYVNGIANSISSGHFSVTQQVTL